MIRFAALGLFALALAACGRSQSYPPHYEAGFMQACEAQSAAPGLCACTWARIEAEVAPDDFAALERLPGVQREAHPLMTQIRDYRQACLAQIGSGAAEPLPAQ